jgi:Lrp/AsnC family transcriptional regulator for asnA, asnC and gidA
LDKIDFEILRILCNDARVPFKRIAVELGIAAETVVRRFKKLEEDGVILGSSVVLSSKACGFTELVGFFVKTKSGFDIETIRDKLINVPQVNSLWQEWGAFDFYIESFMKNLSEMHELVTSFRRIEGIESVSPIIYEQRDWPIPFQVEFLEFCILVSAEDT